MALTYTFIGVYILMLVITGYVLPLIKNQGAARLIGWLIAIATAVFSGVISSEEEPLGRMLIIVTLQLLSMKILVMIESYSGENRLTVVQWVAFCLGWFGMRPVLFEKLPSSSIPFGYVLFKGISRIVMGTGLLYLSVIFEKNPHLQRMFIPQLALLGGLSLILHFGVLNISTAVWRMMGVNVTELFQSPYRSRSLKEFWGKRWNNAFSEMTALISYRPLKNKIGAAKASIISFLLSGLLHEVAISLPVMGGFGSPMIFFIIHAVAMYVESHSTFVQRITGHRWLSHVWVMSLLILPMPLLFHHEFIQQVLVPLRMLILQAAGLS